MSEVIGVYQDGELEWHMKNFGPTDHVTACGLDGDDEGCGQSLGPEPKRGQKITCRMCYTTFKGFKRSKIKASDFDANCK